MYINILKISLYKNNSIYFFYNIRCTKKNNGYNYLCTCYENCTLPLSVGFGVDFCGGWGERRGWRGAFFLVSVRSFAQVVMGSTLSLRRHDMHNHFLLLNDRCFFIQQTKHTLRSTCHYIDTCTLCNKVANVLPLGRGEEGGSLGPKRHLEQGLK